MLNKKNVNLALHQEHKTNRTDEIVLTWEPLLTKPSSPTITDQYPSDLFSWDAISSLGRKPFTDDH